ncbi:MAG: hypothetical protein K2J39_00115 [Ruminococcus sp.]|nr:hypothetical protein [Ruminococcus sp.]
MNIGNDLRKSNFNSLIKAMDIFNEIHPEIEYHRLYGIKKQIIEIVRNTREDLQVTEQERKSLKFDYIGYGRKIESIFESVQSELKKVIKMLEDINNTVENIRNQISNLINLTLNNVFKLLDNTTDEENQE